MVKPTVQYNAFNIDYPTATLANVTSKLATIPATNSGNIATASSWATGVNAFLVSGQYKEGLYGFVVKVYDITDAPAGNRYLSGTFQYNGITGTGIYAVNLQNASAGLNITVVSNDLSVANTSGFSLRFRITIAPIAVDDA